MAPRPVTAVSEDDSGLPTILFDHSKNEMFRIGENLRMLERKLKAHWRVEVNKDEIAPDTLSGAIVLVLAGPRERFTEWEFESIKSFLEGEGGTAGGLLVALGEGGECSFGTNVNYLIEEYGVMINNDTVVRTHYFKYFHPKECLVPNGVVHSCVPAQLGMDNQENLSQCLKFVYPFGATLNTAKPAVAVLSTGSVSLPLNRPVCAFATTRHGGRIAVVGSGHLFTDRYFDKEDNGSVARVIFDFLSRKDFTIDATISQESEICDYTAVADTAGLAERLRCCLLETTEDLPVDTSLLFRSQLYSLDTSDVIPDIVSAYSTLGIKHEPLRLIPPEFEIPLPPLQLAVFPPIYCEMGPPALELFDLEDEFSDDRSRLAEAANHAIRKKMSTGVEIETAADVESFVLECGDILGLTVREGYESPFGVLYEVAARISEFKKNLNRPDIMILPRSQYDKFELFVNESHCSSPTGSYPE